jgi:hypothetical protein
VSGEKREDGKIKFLFAIFNKIGFPPLTTRFQNRLKVKRLRENYSRDSSVRWKSRGLW